MDEATEHTLETLSGYLDELAVAQTAAKHARSYVHNALRLLGGDSVDLQVMRGDEWTVKRIPNDPWNRVNQLTEYLFYLHRSLLPMYTELTYLIEDHYPCIEAPVREFYDKVRCEQVSEERRESEGNE